MIQQNIKDAVKDMLKDMLRPLLLKSFRTAFEANIIPSFQEATNSMLHQLQGVFEKGLETLASSAMHVQQKYTSHNNTVTDEVCMYVLVPYRTVPCCTDVQMCTLLLSLHCSETGRVVLVCCFHPIPPLPLSLYVCMHGQPHPHRYVV